MPDMPLRRAEATPLLYLPGIQALARLPLLQRRRDAAAGLNTAGFVSGYRGSPLGGLDQALWKEAEALAAERITFQPGLNEDLAATAVWGSQQVGLFPDARHDGVFALWYGKGPGADRSMDVFKHANAAGTARHGGVLAVVGDDHGAKSSTLPHQSDHIFAAAMIPVLNPSGVQELIEFGLHGWAMSRWSGCWVAMKAVADTVETSAAVRLDPMAVETLFPGDFALPPDGLNIRWPDTPMAQEMRLQRYKAYAAMAYARLNGLNRVVLDSPRARLGIASTGKSYLDVRQALELLGLDDGAAAAAGIRLFKVGMPWPLDAEGTRHFAEGLEEILVVEEKRQLIEYQLKEQLYNWRQDVRPRVVGKFNDQGEWDLPVHDWQLPAAGELSAGLVARVIARRLLRMREDAGLRAALARLEAQDAPPPAAAAQRLPHYCPGCPHNSSTRVPEGSRALAGIGCHYMALWMNPEQTQTFSQMGGEGVAWIGQAPFTGTRHVFANLGDGTYAHSGILAIRQAVAARVNITYKILYNDAVAMTGGQPVEGQPSVARIARQVAAEGVARVVVLAEQPERHAGSDLPAGIPVLHRRELDRVQRELRETPGTTVLIFDQTCAAEKRRRRKRGLLPDPARRVFINDRVCEGCGDCSAKSNCLAVVPVETEFGRKRAIDQSACNKDFSCLEGFCPSFVTIEGGRPRPRPAALQAPDAGLPEPALPSLDRPYGILVTGIGGTGVITIGALIGTAAALEGKAATALDMAGLAQKGGPVWSHLRLAARQEQLHASRIAAGEARLVLGCDLVVTAAPDSLLKMRSGHTRAVVNAHEQATSDMVRGFAAQARSGDAAGQPDPRLPAAEMERRIAAACGPGGASFLAATPLATGLLGEAIATNLFLLGYAWQQGLLPVGGEALRQAIRMNGAAVEMNLAAFAWGRRAALDLAAVRQAAGPGATPPALERGLEEIVARRVADLTAYQDAAYAARYAALVERARRAEAERAPGLGGFAEAVARNLYKLMAYKDEYEVARLHTAEGFLERVREGFEGEARPVFHLAPPLLSRRDPRTGEPRKRAFGPWILPVLRGLARARRLRGGWLDPFGHTAERRRDRALLREYEATIAGLCARLNPACHAVAVELAAIPQLIRGYGPVRERHLIQARRREAELRARLEAPVTAPPQHAPPEHAPPEHA
ncbi:indolepyruvate ferredoxin oxidoreductase family protein [Roseomonas sp. KE0001]|uniref:indolepyruvate ferredoxin oxidoreductase family protein n=1 Tax=Roseomonas sp. KE0001 TaxID=2479201 RepID=UPI0018DF8ADC|nr:indolepyruvate ferredoxin oxidoreductase family protein [Roseomonas sp. KE0001]MBI0434507.1 indolepyruvate ferredoxin oxidoreductase family protein [Roseomonas sp. KE0001]